MTRIFGYVLAGGLLLGLASTAQAQVSVSFGRGGYGPGVMMGQPYGGYGGYGNGGYGYGGYRAPAYGYSNFSSTTTYVQPYPGYGALSPTSNYYGRGYSGMGYAPGYGAYAPYGGYAAPNYGGYAAPNYGYGANRGVTIYSPGGYGVRLGR